MKSLWRVSGPTGVAQDKSAPAEKTGISADIDGESA
jgi:hypothetical protein